MTIHEFLRQEKREWRRIRESQDFERVRSGYNGLAHEKIEAEENGDARPYYNDIAAHIEHLGIPTTASILDAGCGAGGACKALKARGFENLSAFDISDTMIQEVSRYVRDAWRGVAENITRPSESFDVVVSSMVIEHCMNPGLCLAEIYRVLKPGGLLYIVTENAWWSDLMEVRNWFTPPSRRYRRLSQPIDGDFTIGELRALAVGCGLVVQDVFSLGGFPWGERVIRKVLGRPTTEVPGLRYFSTRFGLVARRPGTESITGNA